MSATAMDYQCSELDPKKLAHCQFAVGTATVSMEPLHLDSAKETFRRKRRQSVYAKPINAIWELFSDYSNSSTIHGVRYLGEKRRHWSERIWWAIACAVSLIACGHSILDTWQKWDQFPVLVTFAEKSTHIGDIPFPAVTICPSTKIKASMFNYTEIYTQLQTGGRLSADNMTTMKAISNLCYLTDKTLTEKETYCNDRQLFNTFKKFVPTVRDVMHTCTFRGKFKCRDSFYPIWTTEGMCFTFNLLNATDLYTERRLRSNIPTSIVALPDDKAPTSRKAISNPSATTSTTTAKPEPSETPPPRTNTEKILHHLGLSQPSSAADEKLKRANFDRLYPRRVMSSSDSLVVEMRLYDKDIDYLCEGPVQGFKVLLHTAHEVPQVDKYFYRVPLDHETILSVRPDRMETSESLSHYSPARRQCYFNWEYPLDFHKVYTQRNCELECLTRKTLLICKCVTFAMPRDNATRVCGLGRQKCYSAVTLNDSIDQCRCLPACESISYDAELSFARFNLRRYKNALSKPNRDRIQYVRVAVSFKDNQFFASHRRELYGRADFLANCGGLLGLFMGFSLLSLVEVVYYCTLRLACNLQRRRKAKAKARALAGAELGQSVRRAPRAEPELQSPFGEGDGGGGGGGGWGDVLNGFDVKH